MQKLEGIYFNSYALTKDGKKFLFAMVHDVFGYWTLSKGKTEENEIPEDGATRKVKEETIEKEIHKIFGKKAAKIVLPAA